MQPITGEMEGDRLQDRYTPWTTSCAYDRVAKVGGPTRALGIARQDVPEVLDWTGLYVPVLRTPYLIIMNIKLDSFLLSGNHDRRKIY